MDNTLWIRVQIAQNMPSMRPQALDGSIAVESASKDVQCDLKEGCSYSGCEIFSFFFARHMLELAETTMQLFRDILLFWQRRAKTWDHWKSVARQSHQPINRSVSQAADILSLYLLITHSIDRAILNLSQGLHMSILLGITAIGWF